MSHGHGVLLTLLMSLVFIIWVEETWVKQQDTLMVLRATELFLLNWLALWLWGLLSVWKGDCNMPVGLIGAPARSTANISCSIRSPTFIIQPDLMGFSHLGVATPTLFKESSSQWLLYILLEEALQNTDPSSSLGFGISHWAVSEMFFLLPCSAPRYRKLADQSCLSSDSRLDLAKEYHKEMEDRKQWEVTVSSPFPTALDQSSAEASTSMLLSLPRWTSGILSITGWFESQLKKLLGFSFFTSLSTSRSGLCSFRASGASALSQLLYQE